MTLGKEGFANLIIRCWSAAANALSVRLRLWDSGSSSYVTAAGSPDGYLRREAAYTVISDTLLQAAGTGAMGSVAANADRIGGALIANVGTTSVRFSLGTTDRGATGVFVATGQEVHVPTTSKIWLYNVGAGPGDAVVYGFGVN